MHPELRSSVNCERCGRYFVRYGQQRICQVCRKKPEPVPEASLPRPLSVRQKQVVELVRQAKTNREIAYELHLTESTIRAYLNRIFRKVGATNRTALATWAWKQSKGEFSGRRA